MSDISGDAYGRPSCKHGFCHLVTSFSTENPGRRFWRCPRYTLGGGCGHFVWIDPPYEGRARTALLKVIRKLQLVEGEKLNMEQDIEKIKLEFEVKMSKLQSEKKLLKDALKRTKFRVRICSFIFLWIFSLLALMWWRSAGYKVVSYPKQHCLPNNY